MRTAAGFASRRALAPPAARVVRDTLIITLIAAAVGALAAAVVVVFDVGASLRDWYGLTPDNPAQIGVVELWLHNTRTVLLAFGAAAAVSWWPAARRAIDVVLVVVLSVNVLVVAVALGAYGESLWSLGPAHYPLELVAAAIAGAAYLDTRRRQSIDVALLTGCAIAAALVLLAGAVVESGAAS